MIIIDGKTGRIDFELSKEDILRFEISYDNILREGIEECKSIYPVRLINGEPIKDFNKIEIKPIRYETDGYNICSDIANISINKDIKKKNEFVVNIDLKKLIHLSIDNKYDAYYKRLFVRRDMPQWLWLLGGILLILIDRKTKEEKRFIITTWGKDWYPEIAYPRIIDIEDLIICTKVLNKVYK